MLAFSCAYLGMRRMSDLGITATAQLVWICGLGVAGYLALSLGRRESMQIPGTGWIWVIGAGMVCILGNYFQVLALSRSPNPAYALAFISCSTAVVYLVSAIFLGAPWSGVKCLGLLLCVTGVILVSV